MRYCDKKNNRIIIEGGSPTPEFWDEQSIIKELKKHIESARNERFVSNITAKFIKPDKTKKILEGGCGRGHFVYSLKYNGYDAYGVDFAKETIKKINLVMPDLKVNIGDVRHLDFPDNFFDGYWSLGVIEHFFEGYDEILSEMKRVIKKNGYLFLTFPHMSFLRKLKMKMGLYPPFNANVFDMNLFYHFALDPAKVKSDLEKLGFRMVYSRQLEGIKGLKDEISILNKPLQKIYNSQNFFVRALNYFGAKILAPFSAHAILQVFKRNQ
ncbi:MAG: S-adenosylmethionine (SAM)-dependent methyltransferase [uncultured bacterium]|nr:MAG: S-adenosylmethionine (SAM)-dependent methyltransferase [uncultured bacterium]